MTYNLVTDTGSLALPSNATVQYKGLDLIGRDSINWNEPIQQNFVAVADELDTKALASEVLTPVPANAVFTDTVYDDSTIVADIAALASDTTAQDTVTDLTYEVTRAKGVEAGLASDVSTINNTLSNKADISSVPTKVSELTNDAGYLTSETDSQLLSLSGTAISISNGNSVDLSSFLDDTKLSDSEIGAMGYTKVTKTSDITNDSDFTTQVYVDNKVLTPVPANAVFTDTVYTLPSDVAKTTDLHSHSNSTILDKFGEDANGEPTYNGNAIDTTIAQRDVYNGLDSTDTSISLSAAQGKVLNDSIAAIGSLADFDTAFSSAK
jgi:hypothetical protein